MNMISTGAFQTEWTLPMKDVVKKLVGAWEKKNAKVNSSGFFNGPAVSSLW